jgi:hypothetical protein
MTLLLLLQLEYISQSTIFLHKVSKYVVRLDLPSYTFRSMKIVIAIHYV